MLKLHFRLLRLHDSGNIYPIYSKYIRLSRNKNLEIELYKLSKPNHLIDFNLCTDFSGENHAGPEFHMEILHFNFYIKLYDSRHWDYDNNSFDGDF